MAYNKKLNLYEGWIYQIYSDVDSKIYIGQTCVSIKTRWSQHIYRGKYDSNHTTYLYKAMNKYGIDMFHIKIIKTVYALTNEELLNLLNKLEIEYIQLYNSLVPNGYNLTIGGDNYGEAYKVPIDQYSKNGNLINSFNSIIDAASHIRDERNIKTLPISNIIKCCHGDYQQSMGYIWRYKGDPFNLYLDKKYGNKKSIVCYDFEGHIIGEYESISAAIKKLEIHNGSTSAISQCCLGRTNYVYDYVWRYKGDSFDKYPLKIHKTEVDQYTLDGIYIATYTSMSAALKSIGKEKSRVSNIKNVCERKGKYLYGYVWRYKGDSFD